MTQLQQFTFRSHNGRTDLHARMWTAPDVTPRGVVQLIHGVSEHISRYDDFARYLAKNGFVVVGHDHLGHGDSLPTGDTPIWFADKDGWQIVTDDVAALYRLTHEKYPELPYFFLGHSMGSFLLRSLLIRRLAAPRGAIIMGTGWNSEAAISGGLAVTALLGAVRGKRSTSNFVTNLAFGGYNKAFAPNRTGFDWIAADKGAVDRYIADPKCGEDATIGLFRDMLQGFRFNQKAENLRKMDKTLPILLIAGQDDPVGAMGRGVEKTRDAFVAAGMQDVSLHLCPGLRHEILNEPSAPQVNSCDWSASL